MRAVLASGIVAACLSGAAQAQTSTTLSFTGTVDDACAVTLPSDGTLDLSSDYTQLSSKLGSGSPGGATVVSTDADNVLDVDAAVSFASAPTGGGDNVTFNAEYDATGATTAADVPAGTPTTLGFGATTVSVDAWADKTSDVFPAGGYAMDVTVRCTAP